MLILFSVSIASAGTYSFSKGDLGDLDHSYAYRWGIYWSAPNGETIVGTSLSIETAATPIPAPILLLGTGLIGMAGFRRKFKKDQ